MRKTLLLTLALLLSVTIFGQNRSVLLRETFDSMQAPSGWITSDNATDNWTLSKTNRAGGEANELKFNPNPKVVGISRMITTPVNLTEISSVSVSFRHFFDKKSMSATIGIATSSNNGQNWSSAWSKTYSEAGQYTVTESIKTPDMGKENVIFCIYFQGNSSSINGWFFDDFEIATLEPVDAKVESIDMYDIIPAGKNDIVFSVQNTGSEVVKSFEAQFTMGGETFTESFETELAQFETEQFSFEQQIKLTPNIYNAVLKITSVNGQEDSNALNNTARKNIRVALNKTQRLPMIEHFSSSTCASCVPLDGTMKELAADNPGKYVYTKYPMNWPAYVDIDGDGKADGDPYYTTDGGVRKTFYNVSGVPFLAFNGIGHSHNAVTQEELDDIYNAPAFIDIKGAFNVNENDNTINISADIMSYIDINNVKVHFSLNEKITNKNTGSNGLTEFHHIMMKMFPDANGNATDFKTGEAQHFEFSYDLSKTFVEEINDLEVAVWIQDVETREILNSNYLYEYQEHPYPVKNLQFANDENLTISWEAPEKGNPTGYNLYINNELVLENTTELSYIVNDPNGFYGVEVVALYENGLRSVGTADKIIVGCHAPVNINATLETFVEDFDYKHRVTLTWDAVDEADFYTVYVNGEKLSEVEETSFVTGFDGSGTYNYTITSNCASIESEHSETCIVFLEIAGIEENNISIGIYPNPANDKLFIETEVEILEVSVYDVYGRQQSTVNGQQSLSIDVNELNSGIYFVRVVTSEGEIVKRFIKK